MRYPSAGISSPLSSLTISPTTTSCFFMLNSLAALCAVFLLNTFTGLESLTLLRISNSLSAFSSKMNPTPVARSRAVRTPDGSIRISHPLSIYIISYTATRTEKKKTIRRTIMIGSLNFSRYNFQRDSFSGGGIIFFPTPDFTKSESSTKQMFLYEPFVDIIRVFSQKYPITSTNKVQNQSIGFLLYYHIGPEFTISDTAYFVI
jgi:hypothetical protein